MCHLFQNSAIFLEKYGNLKLDISSIPNNFETPIIEDAAESLGAEYKNRKCGSFGEISILSFNGNKIITTSGGGMLVSNKAEHCEKATYLATPATEPHPHYEHTEIGYNFHACCPSPMYASVSFPVIFVSPLQVGPFLK